MRRLMLCSLCVSCRRTVWDNFQEKVGLKTEDRETEDERPEDSRMRARPGKKAIDALRSLRLCETIFKEKSWFEDGRPETEDRRPEEQARSGDEARAGGARELLWRLMLCGLCVFARQISDPRNS